MLNIFVLKSLEFLYKIINFIRRRLSKGDRIDGKVIVSVGNLGFGGSGKTPIVIAITKFLEERGIKSGVLLRGYKSKLEKKGGEVLENDTEKYGDEAVLIKRNLERIPVFVGKDRVKNIKESGDREIPVFILDDGFQFFGLRKDIEILVEDEKPFLRRDFKSEKKRADFILKRGEKNFGFYFSVKGIFPFLNSKEGEFIAFCGIGNPKSFESTLKKAGIKFSGFIVFPDHHNYTEKDVKKLEAFGKKLITTEKDFVKLEKYGIKELYYLKIEAVLTEDFKKEFLKKVEEKIKF